MSQHPLDKHAKELFGFGISREERYELAAAILRVELTREVSDEEIRETARAICRVQYNGADPDQPAIRWNGTEMEPQEFPAWHDFRDEALCALKAAMAARRKQLGIDT